MIDRKDCFAYREYLDKVWCDGTLYESCEDCVFYKSPQEYLELKRMHFRRMCQLPYATRKYFKDKYTFYTKKKSKI